VTLRDRERAVLELARDDLARLRRDAAESRDRDRDRQAADDLALRRKPEERDLARLAFLATAERRLVL